MDAMEMQTSSWAECEAAEAKFAEAVWKRFTQYKHHVLATLRADGSPRVTGLETDIRFGELWLGMMPNSRKALDLRRDPRFAVYANPGPDAGMQDGDVRVSGRAVEVTNAEALSRYADDVHAPQPFHLFRAELTEVVHTGVDNDELVMRVWRPGTALRTIRRGNSAEPPREDTQRPASDESVTATR
ncbi:MULTISPECIES: pyridoxamine 5'-phosphate oxidase family protein [unclassified Streptomyces]|uniref:pyridoxamine 5'-phosphate oxidase family protein n=1 Tax=unclassified Streptomyces TaxID=2593676 RepID=UPI00081B0131|nr:pyridoxamine 5'-phosphate oxidase family protein [Streptomyces sp. BvitLS-983]SCE07427.1 Pyridoxamine 5'-phosphate oxidase [Streptomyces sp. BvitLS-983]